MNILSVLAIVFVVAVVSLAIGYNAGLKDGEEGLFELLHQLCPKEMGEISNKLEQWINELDT